MNLPSHIICLALLLFTSFSSAKSSEYLYENGVLRGEDDRDSVAIHLANLNSNLRGELESGEVAGRTENLVREITKILSEEKMTDTLLVSDSYYLTGYYYLSCEQVFRGN